MRDLTGEESHALGTLGYTEEWLELGVLDSALLLAQHERMQSGGTQKTGRYRAEAIAAWLADDAGHLGDEELDAFLGLMRAEPDAKLAKSCIGQLIQSSRIALEQLERVGKSPEKVLRSHQALIARTRLMRLMEGGVNDDHIEQVIESKDPSIQMALIRDKRLTRKHAEQLAKRGANPTIRERAQKWCIDKQFWKA